MSDAFRVTHSVHVSTPRNLHPFTSVRLTSFPSFTRIGGPRPHEVAAVRGVDLNPGEQALYFRQSLCAEGGDSCPSSRWTYKDLLLVARLALHHKMHVHCDGIGMSSQFVMAQPRHRVVLCAFQGRAFLIPHGQPKQPRKVKGVGTRSIIDRQVANRTTPFFLSVSSIQLLQPT